MKLIDILARDLKVWPEGELAIAQLPDGSFMGINSGLLYGTGELAIDFRRGPLSKVNWQIAVDALKAKKIAAWNGEGLPPVGAVCVWDGCTFAAEDPKEPDLHVGDQVKIIAHFKDGDFDLAAFTFNPRIHNPDRGTAWVNQGAHGCFRPIRTPEQIEAEERENAACELYRTINWHGGVPEWKNQTADRRNDYFKAIDAGYRKEKK